MKMSDVRSPLFLLDSVSGIPSSQRVQPREYTFRPRILPADIEVISAIIDPSIVEEFKRAIENFQTGLIFELLDKLYLDKTLLVQALVESAIEYINAGSLNAVSLILENVRESMDAKTVLKVISILLRTDKFTRSLKYSEFVNTALSSSDPFYSSARDLLEGRAVIADESPEKYHIIVKCSPKYQAYPVFAEIYAKTEPEITLPGLTGKATKKATELEALRNV